MCLTATSASIDRGIVRLMANVAISDDVRKHPLKQRQIKDHLRNLTS